MELVNGITLTNLMTRGDSSENATLKPISEELCKIIMYQCTVALIYLHSMKVAHRDLKLDNIMICGLNPKEFDENTNSYQKIKIKLIDFGLSKYKQNNSNKMNSDCGTLDYMPPEVLMRKDYDEGCDMWSLGVIAYFLMSGFPPFYSQKEAKLK